MTDRTDDKTIVVVEQLSRHEVTLEYLEKHIIQNGKIAEDGLRVLSDKLDAIDAKWDTRFTTLENDHKADAKELQALKNKGAGVLAALGVVGTAVATFFSDFFSAVKHAIVG